MAKKLTKAQLNGKLIEIVAATKAGGAVHTPVEVHGPLAADGLVEINAAMTNADGIATRATTAGIEAVDNANANKAAAAAPKPSFVLEKAALPAISGRGRASGETLYPFDQMEPGDSFFVPNDPTKLAKDGSPLNASATLASTVSAATKRYAEVVPGETRTIKGKDGKPDREVPKTVETRKYVVRSRTAAAEAAEGFNHGKDGARVYRTA